MEYWSNDERIDVFLFQHSNTPSLQGWDFQELLEALYYLFITETRTLTPETLRFLQHVVR
jgi:hypothetical protein